MKCQKTYLRDGYCKNPPFGASKWCRWHKIIEEFRSDLSRKPRLFSQLLMFGSSMCFGAVFWCSWMLFQHGTIIWLLLAILMMGSSAKFFADGCIAQDHPFTQFSLWGKMLLFGLILEIVSGAVTGFYLLNHGHEADMVVDKLTEKLFWLKYGPALLIAAIFLNTGFSLKLCLDRVLFIKRPALNSMIFMLTLMMVVSSLRPFVHQVIPLRTAIESINEEDKANIKAHTEEKGASDAVKTRSPELSRAVSNNSRGPEPVKGSTQEFQERLKTFGQPVIGKNYKLTLVISLLIGFIVAEILNKRIRTRGKGRVVFRATVWPSFPICFGSPFFGIVGIRYLMVWLQIHNAWLFGIGSVLVAAFVVTIQSKWLIRSYLSSLSRSNVVSDSPKRGARQELLLYLKQPKPSGNKGVAAHLLNGIIYEIEMILDYSGVGSIAGREEKDQFVILHIAGASAESIYLALHNLLKGISIHQGSFVVMKFGGHDTKERVIEL